MSLWRRSRSGTIDREQAFNGRPFRTAGVKAEALDGGGLRVAIGWMRPRWQRWLGGGDGHVEKRYDLDACGREVFEACDGARTVRTIVHDFAQRRHLSLAEAELSVTAFLRMLKDRGLIGLRIPQKN